MANNQISKTPTERLLDELADPKTTESRAMQIEMRLETIRRFEAEN